LLFIPKRVKIEYKGGLFKNDQIQIDSLSNLIQKIKRIRNDFFADNKFHFADISGKRWVKRNEAERKFIHIGVDSLKQKGNKALFCKFGVIFYKKPKGDHISLYGGRSKKEKEMRYGETLLRMLLKGTIHYLYDVTHKVKIFNIITDGQPHNRKLDDFRVLQKMTDEVRDYVEIRKDAELIHLSSDHKHYAIDAEERVHANMLQIADMLLGGSIYAFHKNACFQGRNPKIGHKVEDKKSIIALPVKEMLDKRKRGRNFHRSSHYKAFTISKAIIQNNNWKFENVMSKEIKINHDKRQISFLH
jgi:hypothetical protein